MKKPIYLLVLLAICSCHIRDKSKSENDTKAEVGKSDTLIVYDTIRKELNRGEQLLSSARKKLKLQKERQSEVKVSDNRKLMEILMKYQGAGPLSQGELQEFLKINPADLQNSAELSAIYNETLFEVVGKNNKMFVHELVKQPELSIRLAPELSNPIDDQIQKEVILKNTRDEYQIQIDNRINELEDQQLLMQYYIEKQKVFEELEGNAVDLSKPQKIQELDQSIIKEFETDYRLENRIPDAGMGLEQGVNPTENEHIEFENIQVDLNQFREDNPVLESIDQKQLEELQKIEQLQGRSNGS